MFFFLSLHTPSYWDMPLIQLCRSRLIYTIQLSSYLPKMFEDFLSKFFMCVKFCQIQWKYKNILIFFKRGIKTIGNGWKIMEENWLWQKQETGSWLRNVLQRGLKNFPLSSKITPLNDPKIINLYWGLNGVNPLYSQTHLLGHRRPPPSRSFQYWSARWHRHVGN